MRFPGIIPAVTTPFDAAGEIDIPALHGNLAALLDAGIHGIVATGTMGEAGSLSNQERRTVVDAVVEAAAGRVPVVVGVSAATPSAPPRHDAPPVEDGPSAMTRPPPLPSRRQTAATEAYHRA